VVTIQADGDSYTLRCAEGQFYEEGASREDLLHELECTLDYVWEKFVEGDPNSMNDGAVRYREWLISHAKKR